MLTITWLLSMVVGMIEIGYDEKCRPITGNFDHHADAALQCGANHTMEHIPVFTRSHCMPLSGKCLHCIAAEAAMVTTLAENTKTSKKLRLDRS